MNGPTTLVIGYGNPLRGDDGAGPRVAAAVATWGLHDVATLSLPQLTPDLAEPLARARRVIFVDARHTEPQAPCCIHRIEPARRAWPLGHLTDPQGLLALAQAAFGRHPEAWLLTIPAHDLSLGARLSAAAEREAAKALDQIARLLRPAAAADARCMNSA